MCGRFRVTTIPRTLIDLGSTMAPEKFRRMIADGVVRGLVEPRRAATVLDGASHVPIRARRALQAALAPFLADGAPKSVAEVDVLRLLDDGGIEPPVCQLEVSDGKGFTAVIDFAWPRRRVALEVDGYRWHSTPDDHAYDYRRANFLGALGWIVVRTTPAEIALLSAKVLATLRNHLSRPLGPSAA